MGRTIEKRPVAAELSPAPEQAKETPDIKKVIDKLIEVVRKEFGPESIHRLSDVEPVNERLPLGIPKLDEILGGGLPKSKLVQITGAESVGKSTFLNFVAARAQHAKDLVHFEDGEMSEDRDRAEDIGVNPELLTIGEPDTLEEAFAKMAVVRDHFLKIERSAYIMLDSVAALPLQSDLDRAYDDNALRADRARFLAANLAKLVRPLKGSKIGMIFVNQLREKANAAPFQKPTYSPGGRALRHWCHLTLEMTRMGALKEHGEVVGIRSRVKIEKSKLTGIKPTAEAFLKIYFDGRVVEDEDGGSKDE